MVAKDQTCDNPCRHKLNPVQLNLNRASLEHHKAMILYIGCLRPTAYIQLKQMARVVTASQACSSDASSTILKHNRSNRMTTPPKTFLTMASTPDFGWHLNYKAVTFSM